MSIKHTPGPWPVPHFARDEVSCNCTYILAGDFCGGIANVFFDNGKLIGEGGNDCPPIEEAKANARLIAAAPDLLEALQEVVKQYEYVRSAEGYPSAESESTRKAKEAIAKATGAA